MEEKEFEILESRLKEAFSDYRELAGGKNYRFHHLTSSGDYAEKLSEKLDVEVDIDVVRVAALFHDIGRTEDIEDGYLDPIEAHEGHAETGAEIVDSFISDVVGEEKLEKIRHIIRNHHSEPETVEGKIVQDSDLLYKFGVQTLWRKFHYSAEKGETLPEAIEYFRNSELDRLENRLEEFHFEKSRSVAKERLEDLRETVEKIDREHSGEDI